MIYALANSQSDMPFMQPLQPQNELLMYASTQYSTMAISHILSWNWVRHEELPLEQARNVLVPAFTYNSV